MTTRHKNRYRIQPQPPTPEHKPVQEKCSRPGKHNGPPGGSPFQKYWVTAFDSSLEFDAHFLNHLPILVRIRLHLLRILLRSRIARHH